MRARSLPILLAVVLLAAAGCGRSAPSQTGTAPQATGTPTAADVDNALVSTVQRLSPHVVQIETSDGLGSGVVYDARGDIVTNAHVVGASTKVTVTLAAGDRHPARVIGTFPPDDLAVVRLDPLPRKVPAPARFADSSNAKVGQLVLAIGNPLGLRSSVTNGIVSSLDRTVPEGNGAVIASAIQTSAAINPGNSGGALGNLEGAVIGIPTLAAIDPELGGSQAPGIGFAIPSNTVKSIAAQLIANGKVSNSGRAFLGVSVATTMTTDGVAVVAVTKGGPAADAGVRRGDIITAVDHHATPTADALTTVLAGLRPGTTVPVAVRGAGDGRRATVAVTLSQLPPS